ncbi:hypothetical protein I6N91_02620 [Arthrobacter sp. MSA 4-2]|uniref:hypothetical protein n=1 Tax=Arthrobacter sp. MSA 4-2 TaxID=2794349 RepID=UPI0018E70659|nr:hypothetical protein [Arthrobacter sp. MSA 4-2]MBJ2119874.1 hypothetical protein [Arthrobacter sp. MSA 4-2]
MGTRDAARGAQAGGPPSGLVRTEPLVGILVLTAVTGWLTSWKPAPVTAGVLAAIFLAFAAQLLNATLDNLRTSGPAGPRRPSMALGAAALLLPVLLILLSSYSLIVGNNLFSLTGLAVGVLLFWAGRISLDALRSTGSPERALVEPNEGSRQT